MAESSDYSVGQKVIHWIMAFFIILDIFVVQKFGGVMEGARHCLTTRIFHVDFQ
jgi:cytochrome b561